MNKKQLIEKEKRILENKKFLLKFLKEGSMVYTAIRKINKQGTVRHMSVYIAIISDYKKEPAILDITRSVSILIGTKLKNDYLVVGGCGMDMGFSIVYSLSSILFEGINTKKDTDKGYILNQAWI